MGSTKLLISQDGQHRFTGDDDPFGINLRSFGDKDTHRYTGQILDEEQGVYYYGARYYLPEIGRFLSGDPKGQFLSPYIFVGNHPTISIDPNGKWEVLGHYWGMYVAALATGFNNKKSSQLAAAAWAPDTDDRSATSHMSLNQKNYYFQQHIHLLNGKSSKDTQKDAFNKFSELISESNGLQDLKGAKGENVAHAFGDSFAHAERSGTMYKPGLGHATDSLKGMVLSYRDPDNPFDHSEAWTAYMSDVYQVLAREAQKNNTKPTMSYDEYMRMVINISHIKKPEKQIEEIKKVAETLLQKKGDTTPLVDPKPPLPMDK